VVSSAVAGDWARKPPTQAQQTARTQTVFCTCVQFISLAAGYWGWRKSARTFVIIFIALMFDCDKKMDSVRAREAKNSDWRVVSRRAETEKTNYEII
jgi:hypothetical protein